MSGIQFPYARSMKNTQVTHISNSDQSRYECVGCGDRMIPKAKHSKVVSPHFAHVGGACSGESTLHRIAKELIAGGITADPTKYELGCRCTSDGCFGSTPVIVKSLPSGTKATTESTIVEGSRSDVVVQLPSGEEIIIEVLALLRTAYQGHDLAPKTLDLYRVDGRPVFKVKADWEALDRLNQQAIAFEVINLDVRCLQCKIAEESLRIDLEILEGRINPDESATTEELLRNIGFKVRKQGYVRIVNWGQELEIPTWLRYEFQEIDGILVDAYAYSDRRVQLTVTANDGVGFPSGIEQRIAHALKEILAKVAINIVSQHREEALCMTNIV